ncbi:titin isoform X1 [Scophthalmus maximus]|uniref:titin isoform X1 n=1 Tax=Scophthalmus maximus TaxID=52904 RepID=UPI001FA8C59B|nr:titin isoform X1 [Scophthalmus maximus]
MWLIKVFGVIYFTAVCAAQYPPNVTSMPISPTTDVPESMEPSYYLPTTIYEPPVPSLQLQSDWLDVFPSEKVKFICEISGSSDWTISWHRNNQSQDADPNVSFSADGSVLTITAETQMYSGSYFCKGHHKAKAVSTQSSNSLELKVFANKPKPTVSRKPNFDKMFLGESVTFTCAAGDFSGWEYLWYHDGKEIQAPKTDVYTIDSVDHSYSGEYSCKAKRGKGPFYTEESETRSLLVSDPPTTSLKLLSPWLDVFENETVELKCEVEGSDWLTFTWYKNQQKLQTDLDEDSPYLNITQVTQTDQGVYACKVQIAFRNVISELSNNATVIVYENTPKPTLSKVPDFAQMYVGEKVNFTCKVDVSSGWNYKWYINGTLLPSATSKTITSSLSDGGKYSCKATRGEETSTAQSAEIQQDVHEIPLPDLKQTTQWLDVFPSESVKLSCDMQRGSDWTYTWRKDGQKVQADDIVSFDSNGKTLSISSASAKHAGQYNCNGHLQGRSVISNSSPELTLTVYDKKPNIVLTQDPGYKVMFPGESVSYSCHLNVSSGWEYLYYKDRDQLGVSGITYSINSVGTANRGSYTCQAKRGKTQVFFSSLSQVMHLEVKEKKPKPLMTQEPKADKVYVGESVSFVCEVDVSSGWEYHWSKDGIALHSNSNVFKIRDASSSDNGNYECVAKRDKSAYHTLNSDRRSLQISEIPVPDLKQTTQWLDVFPTESVKLSCGMAVSSDWTYTWHKDGQRVRPDDTVSFGTNGTTLSITSASAKHAGQYKCSGRLNNRPVNSPITSGLTLSIYDTKPRVTLLRKPEYDVMHTGDPVSFSCHINVSSGWEYLWYKDGSPLAESEKTRNISSVTMKHTGSYTCRVKRGRNAVFQSDPSQTVRLDIQERPQANIILLTGWSEVFSTDSLALRCEVQESQEMWNYTWFREGQPIDLPPSKRHVVTPQNDPEQSLYTCRGISTGRPSYSKLSESFKTKNLLLKRRVLLSISGCLFFGLIAVFLGCIILRILHKPARNEDMLEEENLFLTMAQLKDRTDAPNPLVEYITDEALNASSKEADENGTIFSETTALPISTPEDQAATTEGDGTEEDMGGLISFKQ